MTLTAPAAATGSELVMVNRGQAGDWQRALATLGGRLPVGWDGTGEGSGGVAGYDLVLAAPRTLSALAWFLLCAGQEELAEPIHQAHRTPSRRCRSSSRRYAAGTPSCLATSSRLSQSALCGP
jgi:hypothetical protein